MTVRKIFKMYFYLSHNTSVRYYRYILLLVTVFGGCLYLLSFNNNLARILLGKLYTEEYSTSQEESYTINTEGCTIPGMQLNAENMKQYVFYPSGLQQCPHSNQPLLKNNKTHIWTTNLNYYSITSQTNLLCCYRSFYRPISVDNIYSNSIDDIVEYKNCTIFSDIIEAKDEFVEVTCIFNVTEVYIQYFVFVAKKNITLYDNDKEAMRSNSYNVIMLGIDGVSRLNLHRTMPKTVAYLKKKGAVELLGYNKIGDNSFPNIVPMLMGYKHTELNKICHPYTQATFEYCPFIWNQFKESGYYTAFAEDSSYIGTFNNGLGGFMRTPTDYYLHPFIHQAEHTVGVNKDRTSYLCMNDKYFFEVLLDYIDDLTSKLRSSRLFGFFWEVTMSHDFLNYPMIMDFSYKKLLKKLSTTKYLDETILIVLSDHGIRWGDIRSTTQGNLEERLPFVFVLTPPSFRKNYETAYNNLKLNSGRLTSPLDIYAMLSDLADLTNINNEAILTRSQESYVLQREISLFLPIPPNRTCQMADIQDHWCTCHKAKKIPKTDLEAVEGAKEIIKTLNSLVKEYKQCASMSLAEVVDATELIWSFTPEKGGKEFMIVVRAEPGDGVFEATLRFKSRKWTLVGTASRLNLYGNQSHCVQNPQLKLYCYCK